LSQLVNRPRLFIGSASETLPIAKALRAELEEKADTRLWNETIEIGEFTLDGLRREAAGCDFAVFVWGTEDISISRGQRAGAPRDNVVYEAGMFAGTLGESRVFVVRASDTKVPSDMLGISTGIFDPAAPDIATIAKQIGRRVDKLGQKPATRLSGLWWQIVLTLEQSSVVSFFEIEPTPNGRSVAMHGRAWSETGELGRWHATASSFDESSETLHYSWQGSHPKKMGVPEYLGVGTICYHDPNDVTGEFSSSPRARMEAPEPTRIKSTIYKRATLEEIAVMTGDDSRARKALIAEKLRLRQGIV